MEKLPKNILIISPLYHPEINRVNDLVGYLLKKNYRITILCPIPNYPEGKYYKNYGIFKKRYEKFDNLTIVRILVYPRKNGSKINLFLNYLSFIIFSIIPAIILSFQKFDLVFVNQLSPITVAIPGIIVKKIKRIPMIMWVTDLWPESIKDAGNLKSDFIPNLILPIVRYIYKNCDQILVTSKGNIHKKPVLTFKGLPIIENDEFIYGLEEEIENVAKTFSLKNRKQEINLINALKITCRKYSKAKTGKKPYTNINLVRI